MPPSALRPLAIGPIRLDFPVVQAVVLVLAVIYVALTMLADLMNAVLDPRLRSS